MESCRTKRPRLRWPSALQVLVLECGLHGVAAAESRCSSDISSAPLSLFLPFLPQHTVWRELVTILPSTLPSLLSRGWQEQAATMLFVIRVQIAGARTWW